MTEQSQSAYWLDQVVADIIKQHPKGPVTVASGVSPSGLYHIGHFREVLTADALAWGLRQAGRDAKHLHFVDNFDPLRKRYPFLPESFEQYVGWPISQVPDPLDCHPNYAKHFFAEFQKSAASMGVEMDVVFSYEDQYQTGKMVPMIEAVLEKADVVRKIFAENAGRELPDDWTAVQVPDANKAFVNANLKSWDKSKQRIGGIDYTKGEVKLNWRLDWPARWALWNVDVEPYGKEHATKGGSYDTGAEFVRQVFGQAAPYPLPYDTINLKGDNKKMSSSLGNVVTPQQALEMMPAEVLRYFVLRSKPSRILQFDTGVGLYNLIEEYSKIEEQVRSGNQHEFAEAYKLASTGHQQTITSVPFSHMVSVYQAAIGDFAEIQKILERTGYGQAVKDEQDILKREVEYVKNWLAKYAPEEVKFTVQQTLPKVELSSEQTQFLAALAESITSSKDLTGQAMHDLIYAALETAGLKPAQGFQALYRIILGKDSGPKAGWFLASLGHEWLVKRLRTEH